VTRDSSGSGYPPVASPGELDNEPSRSVEDGKCFDQLRDCNLLEKDFDAQGKM
jgi:hypothetical protein